MHLPMMRAGCIFSTRSQLLAGRWQLNVMRRNFSASTSLVQALNISPVSTNLRSPTRNSVKIGLVANKIKEIWYISQRSELLTSGNLTHCTRLLDQLYLVRKSLISDDTPMKMLANLALALKRTTPSHPLFGEIVIYLGMSTRKDSRGKDLATLSAALSHTPDVNAWGFIIRYIGYPWFLRDASPIVIATIVRHLITADPGETSYTIPIVKLLNELTLKEQGDTELPLGHVIKLAKVLCLDNNRQVSDARRGGWVNSLQLRLVNLPEDEAKELATTPTSVVTLLRLLSLTFYGYLQSWQTNMRAVSLDKTIEKLVNLLVDNPNGLDADILVESLHATTNLGLRQDRLAALTVEAIKEETELSPRLALKALEALTLTPRTASPVIEKLLEEVRMCCPDLSAPSDDLRKLLRCFILFDVCSNPVALEIVSQVLSNADENPWEWAPLAASLVRLHQLFWLDKSFAQLRKRLAMKAMEKPIASPPLEDLLNPDGFSFVGKDVKGRTKPASTPRLGLSENSFRVLDRVFRRKQKPTKESDLERKVGAILKEWSLVHACNVELLSGVTVDFVLLPQQRPKKEETHRQLDEGCLRDKANDSGLNARHIRTNLRGVVRLTDLQHASAGASPICDVIEVQGPYHYCVKSKRPRPDSSAKRIMIRRLGFNLVEVPYWLFLNEEVEISVRKHLVKELMKVGCLSQEFRDSVLDLEELKVSAQEGSTTIIPDLVV